MSTIELQEHRTQDQTRQSCWFTRRTYDVNGLKVRTTVRNDPYTEQCDFYAEVFSPATLSWNRIHSESRTEWAPQIGMLWIDKHTKPEALAAIDRLHLRLITVADDILDGVA